MVIQPICNRQDYFGKLQSIRKLYLPSIQRALTTAENIIVKQRAERVSSLPNDEADLLQLIEWLRWFCSILSDINGNKCDLTQLNVVEKLISHILGNIKKAVVHQSNGNLYSVTGCTLSSSLNEEIGEPICSICLKNFARFIFIPCGHLCICKSCLDSHRKEYSDCPICRKPIDNAQTCYFPTTNKHE